MRSLSYYGHSHADYIICKKTISLTNRETIEYVIKMALIIMPCLVAASFMLPFIERHRLTYIVTVPLLVVMALAFRYLRFLRENSILSAYLLMTVLYGFAIALAIAIEDRTSSVFNLLLVILPVFLIDNFLRMSLYTLVVSCIYCTISYQVKLTSIAAHEIFICLCFYCISVMTHYYVNHRVISGMLSDRKRDDALASYQKAQQELRAQVQKDPLTGLYNRSAFIEQAVLQLKKCRELSGYPALGILDLDHFKEINDTFGHQAGDQVLVGVASILQKTLRDTDIVGRLGGDEYIFVLTEIGDEVAAAAILTELLERVSQLGRDLGIPVHGSVGVVVALDERDLFDSLYYKADIALYNAKNTGRNRYVFYTEGGRK
ncbi:diguanylate cyclase [Oscillospiraceae bacterium LTW-04]|nr:GGDEF domain-containing protein [Oscillospiraceae bacterium MB24-C1]